MPEQGPQLARFQEVLIRGRPPPQLPLLLQERLGQEVAARLDGVEEVRKAAAIQVVELQHETVRAIGDRRTGQVGLHELDGHLRLLRRPLRFLQPRRVAVDGNHRGTPLSCRDRMDSLAAGQVEDPHVGVDKAHVPLEPCAGDAAAAGS